jgi:hypothetical protein
MPIITPVRDYSFGEEGVNKIKKGYSFLTIPNKVAQKEEGCVIG